MSEIQSTPVENKSKKSGRTKIFGLGCLGLVVLACALATGIWFLGSWQSQQLFASAETNRTAGDYEATVTDLEKLIADYDAYDEAQAARALLPEVQLEWAGALRDQGEFETALARYDEVGGVSFAERVAEGKLETRLDWGEALIAEGKFDEALAQFEQVMDEAGPDSVHFDRARAALPEAYVGLAEKALAAGDIPKAYAHLTYMFDNYRAGSGREKALASFQSLAESLYEFAQQNAVDGDYVDAALALSAIVAYAPEATITPQAQAQLPELYLKQGQAAFAAEEYEAAIAAFQTLLDDHPDSEQVVEAEKGLVDAQVAAINQSGTAGELPAPQASGGTTSEDLFATYDIENDTTCSIVVLLSGPESQAIALDAQTIQQIDLEPGTYNVVVKTDESADLPSDCRDIIPFTTETLFESGWIYESSFYIRTVFE